MPLLRGLAFDKESQMKALVRRAALKTLGKALLAAPFGAHTAGEIVKTNLLNSTSFIEHTSNAVDSPSTRDGNRSFTSFAKYMLDIGNESIRDEAKHIYGFDPEIIDMHLPMQSKVRMQQNRNYDRLLKSRKNWFEKAIAKDGKASWWG